MNRRTCLFAAAVGILLPSIAYSEDAAVTSTAGSAVVPVATLSPAPTTTPAAAVGESIVITATRTERSVTEVPVSASVMGHDDIVATPGKSVDDVIRTLPSVDLPIASSYEVHPTSNSISMRGLGGYVRALVLLDGVPLNDGFMGYVQWNQVPLENVERVEVIRGGTASLWGNFALGGVINVLTRRPEETKLVVEDGYGDFGTNRASVYASTVAAKRIHVYAEVDRMQTDGFDEFVPDQRTPIDVPTAFSAANARGGVSVDATDQLEVGAHVSYHDNHQTLFTKLDTNALHIWNADAHATQTFANGATGTLTVFHNDSNFVTANTDTPGAAAPGTAEYVQNLHRTIYQDSGVSLLGTTHFGPYVPIVSLGVDGRVIAGNDTARIFDDTNTQVRTDVGRGAQRFLGAFAQVSVFPVSSLEVLLSARAQQWTNFDGFDGTPGGLGDVPDRTVGSFDPRVSVRWQALSFFALRAAGYTAFRAPCLGDLYRAFSTAYGIYLPNSQLVPERLRGGEAGFDIGTDDLRAQVTGFYATVTDLLTYRVLSDSEAPPGFAGDFNTQNINAGAARSEGAEAEVDAHVGQPWHVRVAGTFYDSVITDNPEDPASVNKQQAYVPVKSGVLEVRYETSRFSALGRIRAMDRVFGDNEHTLPIPAHAVADASLAVPLTSSVTGFAQVENLFDQRYIADNNGYSPRQLGTPRTAFAGLRARF